MEQTIELSIPEMLEALKICTIAGVTPCMVSSPGIGKSSIWGRFCQMIDADNHEMRLSDSGVEDLKGVPMPQDDGTLRYYLPRTLPRDPNRRAGLLIDEFKQAPNVSTSNAAARLVLDRKLEDYEMPRSSFIALAANYDTDKAGTIKLPTHLRNRICWLYLRSDLDAWLMWAAGGGMTAPQVERIPIGRRDAQFQMPPAMLAFIKLRPAMLNCTVTTPGETAEDWRNVYAFNTNRSWEFAGRIHHVCQSRGTTGTIRQALLAGCLGLPCSSQYVAFEELTVNAPDVKQVLAGKSIPVPTDPQIKWVTTCAIAQLVTPKNVQFAVDYLKAMGPQFTVLGFKMIKASRGSLSDLGKPFADWALWMANERMI